MAIVKGRTGFPARAACTLVVAAAALSGCGGEGGGGDVADAPRPQVAPGAWVVIGSSTAQGAGASAGRGWVDRLSASYADRAVTLANLAKGGSTTYAGLPSASLSVSDRPAPDVQVNVDAALARTPRLLLVAYPTNDTALGYAVDETVRNLLAIRDAARTQGVAVLVLSTQPRALSTEHVARLVEIDAQVAQAVGPCFVPLREALADATGRLAARYDSGDGVHLNDAGHAVVHDRVRETLEAGRCVRTAS